MRYEIRPISDRTRFSSTRELARFKASWPATESLLLHEVEMLAGRDLVIEVDVTELDIRNDGRLRASANPSSDAVLVAFESKHGPLTYATNRFYGWRNNVRAIALGLQALRQVDRYGITKHGEQYAGWIQIGAGPTGNGVASHMTRQAAAELLERIAIGDEGATRDREVQRILASTDHAREVFRHARPIVHPDRRGGLRDQWDQVEQAARVLGVVS